MPRLLRERDMLAEGLEVVVDLGGGVTCEAGIKGGERFYRQLWKDRKTLVGQPATIRYQNRTPDSSLRFPVFLAVRDFE